jgi:hypothetical protein
MKTRADTRFEKIFAAVEVLTRELQPLRAVEIADFYLPLDASLTRATFGSNRVSLGVMKTCHEQSLMKSVMSQIHLGLERVKTRM